MTGELVGCPFCGWPATAMRDEATNMWAVYCNDDGTCGDDAPGCCAIGPERRTEAEALAAWNARASPPTKIANMADEELVARLRASRILPPGCAGVSGQIASQGAGALAELQAEVERKDAALRECARIAANAPKRNQVFLWTRKQCELYAIGAALSGIQFVVSEVLGAAEYSSDTALQPPSGKEATDEQ